MLIFTISLVSENVETRDYFVSIIARQLSFRFESWANSKYSVYDMAINIDDLLQSFESSYIYQYPIVSFQ